MNIYLIYKQYLDSYGQIEKVELIECDSNEAQAQSFSKLYNLQVPNDIKNRVSFGYVGTHVI
jgi:hypothetical protein